MRKVEREQSWSEFLDKEKQNMLLVKYLFSTDYTGVKEFAVIYLTEAGGKAGEVIKYDCSDKETVHVHRFFSRKKQKRCLQKEKSFETIKELMQDIRKNWRLYRAKYLEKQQ